MLRSWMSWVYCVEMMMNEGICKINKIKTSSLNLIPGASGSSSCEPGVAGRHQRLLSLQPRSHQCRYSFSEGTPPRTRPSWGHCHYTHYFSMRVQIFSYTVFFWIDKIRWLGDLRPLPQREQVQTPAQGCSGQHTSRIQNSDLDSSVRMKKHMRNRLID